MEISVIPLSEVAPVRWGGVALAVTRQRDAAVSLKLESLHSPKHLLPAI